MFSTRIIKQIDSGQFQKFMHSKPIVQSSHALDMLSDQQRKVFEPITLTHLLLKTRSVLSGKQRNGRYSAYYKQKIGYCKIIISEKKNELQLVTFLNTKILPKV